MKILKYREAEPTKCEICGCEYQYELGDRVEVVAQEYHRFDGCAPRFASVELLLECPICHTKNVMKLRD